MSGSSNPVVPFPGAGPMLTPPPYPNYPAGQSPWPQPPSCFSQLSALNACYDSVQMMEQILGKVMTDLVTNNVAVQQAIVEAIAKSGSNVPLIGVTNGSNAQPGQVGEYVLFQVAVTYPAGTPNTQVVSMGVLQPGDWQCWGAFYVAGGLIGTSNFYLNGPPPPASVPPVGFDTTMQGFILTSSSVNESLVVGLQARANLSVPTLVSYGLLTNQIADAGATATTGTLFFGARRMR
jgi:hypothetical protein